MCSDLSDIVYACATAAGARAHKGGAYLCMEGPAFSTRAESKLHRQWGMDVVGMTALPEATLAREAELCFSMLALVTDYDCWHETEADVSVPAVLEVLRRNVAVAKDIIAAGDGQARRAAHLQLRHGARRRPDDRPEAGARRDAPPARTPARRSPGREARSRRKVRGKEQVVRRSAAARTVRRK